MASLILFLLGHSQFKATCPIHIYRLAGYAFLRKMTPVLGSQKACLDFAGGGIIRRTPTSPRPRKSIHVHASCGEGVPPLHRDADTPQSASLLSKAGTTGGQVSQVSSMPEHSSTHPAEATSPSRSAHSQHVAALAPSAQRPGTARYRRVRRFSATSNAS